MFGRNLRAALPLIRVQRPWGGGDNRHREYVGISLAEDAASEQPREDSH